jgi:hypothetical protein
MTLAVGKAVGLLNGGYVCNPTRARLGWLSADPATHPMPPRHNQLPLNSSVFTPSSEPKKSPSNHALSSSTFPLPRRAPDPGEPSAEFPFICVSS